MLESNFTRLTKIETKIKTKIVFLSDFCFNFCFKFLLVFLSSVKVNYVKTTKK